MFNVSGSCSPHLDESSPISVVESSACRASAPGAKVSFTKPPAAKDLTRIFAVECFINFGMMFFYVILWHQILPVLFELRELMI